MADQQKITIQVDNRYSDSELRAIGTDIIDHIVDRTRNNNLDKDNRPLRAYSEEYKNSLEFNIAGKSASDVNLTLTGEMLDSLEVLRVRKGAIEIGYRSGSINDKVEGNRIGSYGQPNGDPRKARDFLGIHPTDLSGILKSYPIGDAPSERVVVEREALRSIIERIGLAQTIELD